MEDEPFAAYLEDLRPPGSRAKVEALIAAIRAAGPFDETLKWGHPYFASRGKAVVKIFVAQAWINVYFFRGTELVDPEQLLEPAPRTRMRKLRLLPAAPVPTGFTELVGEARALN